MIFSLYTLLSNFVGPHRTLFCSQTTPYPRSAVSFCSPWGFVDQYIVVLWFIWFYCVIISILRVFSILSVALSESRCILAFGPSLSTCHSFFDVVDPFDFLWFLRSHIFLQNFFCFPCPRLFVCLRTFSPNLLKELFFIILECPILFMFWVFLFCQYLLIYPFELYRVF